MFNSTGNIPMEGTDNEIGSGLGLILCKDFVEIQSGEISVKSVKDQGSTISFTLPEAGIE